MPQDRASADDRDVPIRSWAPAALALPRPAVGARVDAALPRPPTLRLPLEMPRPATIRLELPARPQVRSFRFARPAAGGGHRPARPAAPAPPPAADRRRRPRIAPPRDVVKLEERFFYLLQPDLETMLHAGRLEFPRRPFPFQFDGMGFLLPRHGAVLADEMGLGKSMQAISALRLLVHSGEVARALVVCPKGLVSNWVRELADWAPELVVGVVEGEPERRRWQWTLPDVPVKVANYEVLVRDSDLVAELGLAFDLVVLDEAQRIKNRESRTNRAVARLTRRRSWALTGTPVENASDDLLGIFEFVAPGQLDRRMSPKELGAAAADHVLRRTKERVLPDMPPRLNRDERI
jgi:hypothetical protein